MTELARREQFLFGARDMAFYWMEDVNCMDKMIGNENLGSDAMVMFSREKDSTGAWK